MKTNQHHVHIKLSSNHKLHETNVLSCIKYLTIGILILFLRDHEFEIGVGH
jgi:hypothetical protein